MRTLIVLTAALWLMGCDKGDGDTSSSTTSMSTTDTGSTTGTTETSTDTGDTCGEADTKPECWDQGPGECSDTTGSAMCGDDGNWTCPSGTDFGSGPGPNCCFPPDC
jgi:hypothetical protein